MKIKRGNQIFCISQNKLLNQYYRNGSQENLPLHTQEVSLGLRSLSRGPISSKLPKPQLDPPGPP